MKFYTGIGSRNTPKNIQNMMAIIAKYLSSKNYILRSGGADGADNAFERGAEKNKRKIYLPFKRFNGRIADNEDYIYHDENSLSYKKAIKYVEKYHPKGDSIVNNESKVKNFMIRNTYQVLGCNLQDPSNFVICWTSDGSCGITTTYQTGGTGQALRIAYDLKIPIYNLRNIVDYDYWIEKLKLINS